MSSFSIGRNRMEEWNTDKLYFTRTQCFYNYFYIFSKSGSVLFCRIWFVLIFWRKKNAQNILNSSLFSARIYKKIQISTDSDFNQGINLSISALFGCPFIAKGPKFFRVMQYFLPQARASVLFFGSWFVSPLKKIKHHEC